jgi:hypothetical protein
MEVGRKVEGEVEGRVSRAFIGHKMHKRHRKDGGRPRVEGRASRAPRERKLSTQQG